MGQYYIVANLDKKQYIYPHDFCSGAKLLEFTGGSYGTAAALAMLTASGNGKGGGDIYIRCYGDWDGLIPDNCIHDENIAYPEMIGYWAGDRIVTAGHEAENGLFLTDEQIDDYKNNTGVFEVPTLHEYAIKFFGNVSAQIIVAMCAEEWLREEKIWLYTYHSYLDNHPDILSSILKTYNISKEQASEIAFRVKNAKDKTR